MSDTSFTKGKWAPDFFIVQDANGKTIAACGFSDALYDAEEEANVHLIAAAPDMYKSLERQRTGLINLIDLSLIPESHIESVRHEVTLIDNELSRARGE